MSSKKQLSPFQKKPTEFGRELTAFESFRNYAMSRLDKMFLDYLPSDDIKAMSPEFLYPIGGFVFLCLIGIFLGVFLNGYYSTVNREFLSPFTGTTASKNCLTIQTVNTGSYLATQKGQWQGQDDFQFGQASYVITLTSASFTYDQYDYLMNKVYKSLLFVKNISVNYDLASNLIHWMSLAYVPYVGNTAQRFSFIGTPLVILNRQKIIGTVSSVAGDCNATSTATFNSDNGLLTLTYEYEEYVNNPVCNDSISPVYLSYLPATDKGYFSMHLDTRSLMTAAAINLGIIEVQDMVPIPDLSSVYNFQGTNYTVTVLYDPKYNGMEPISCIDIAFSVHTNYSFCVLKVQNEVYGIPLFNHYGMSSDLPTVCNCSTIDPVDLDDSYFSCNLFAFLTGVLIFPNNNPDEMFRLFLEIGLTIVNSVLTSPINQEAFTAQFIDSYWGLTSPNRDLFLEPAYREKAYAFCNVPGNNQSCSLITFSIFDKTPQNWAVSDYYYQIPYGACRNTFVTDYEEWSQLIETPFAPLTQNYQKCHAEHTAVMINQAGSSVGNVSILAPLCIALILVCVYLAQVCGLARIKKTYTNAEKDEALSDLALKLLFVRDIDKSTLTGESVLAQLVEELGAEQLNQPDALYRDGGDGRSGQPAVKIDWAALQTRVGLKRRQSSIANSGGTRSVPSASMTSISDGAVFPPEEGDELHAVGSPIHFLDTTPSALAVQAVKHKYVIMNDYEVTPALLQLCSSRQHTAPGGGSGGGSPRSRAGSSTDVAIDGMEAGDGVRRVIASQPQQGATSSPSSPPPSSSPQSKRPASTRATLNMDALQQLLDNLIATFEAVQLDPSKTVWVVVSQTAILRTVNVAALPKERLAGFYYQLHTLLALHASVMLNVSLSEVKQQRARGVAYIVGLDVLTLADIRMRL